MVNYVITIGRQVGSGGSILGKAIAEHFQFSYIDRDLLKKVAEELHVTEDDIESLDEKLFPSGSSLFQSDIYRLPYMSDDWNVPTGARIFEIESKLIKQAAAADPCVVIGRCGSHLFADHEKHVSIFLYADEKHRLERLKNSLDFSYEKSKKMIEKADKARARYFNTYTGKKWLDLTNYDLSINTGRMSEEQLQKVIFEYICDRFPELKK